MEYCFLFAAAVSGDAAVAAAPVASTAGWHQNNIIREP